MYSNKIIDAYSYILIVAVVSLSLVLAQIRIISLPNGGSVTFAVVPILAFCTIASKKQALYVGVLSGICHMLFGGTIIHPMQAFLDYICSYTALSMIVFFHQKDDRRYVSVSISFVMLLHSICMVTSGVIFFSDILSVAAIPASIVYNGATVVPEWLLALLIVPRVVTVFSTITTPIFSKKSKIIVTRLLQTTPISNVVPSKGLLSDSQLPITKLRIR